MTGDDDLETLAGNFAAQGRDALVRRLRAAYTDALNTQSDLVVVDEPRLERMVQNAADAADGLQWRRALAEVAAPELGIPVRDALAHPAVARAHEILGAPSYGAALAALGAAVSRGPRATQVHAVPSDAEAMAPELDDEQATVVEPPEPGEVPAEADEPEAVEAPEDEAPAEAPAAEDAAEEPGEEADEPQPTELMPRVESLAAEWEQPELPPPAEADSDGDAQPTAEAGAAEAGAALEGEAELEDGAAERAHDAEGDESYGEDYAEDEFDELGEDEEDDDQYTFDYEAIEPGATSVRTAGDLELEAIHLGGVANLPTKGRPIGVRLSAEGFDLMRRPGDADIVGRLEWREIEGLEVPGGRGRRRRAHARLVVRTEGGDALFEVPTLSAEELRERIAPFVLRYGGR